MHYDPRTDNFDLCYVVDPLITKPTEIAANFEVHYPHGVEVAVSGPVAQDMTVNIYPDKNLITVAFSDASRSLDSYDCCVSVIKKR